MPKWSKMPRLRLQQGVVHAWLWLALVTCPISQIQPNHQQDISVGQTLILRKWPPYEYLETMQIDAIKNVSLNGYSRWKGTLKWHLHWHHLTNMGSNQLFLTASYHVCIPKKSRVRKTRKCHAATCFNVLSTFEHSRILHHLASSAAPQRSVDAPVPDIARLG